MVKKLVRGCFFIKHEQTIEKAPNFQEILLNIWTSLSQNFNVIAFFFFFFLNYLGVCITQNVCEGVLLKSA